LTSDVDSFSSKPKGLFLLFWANYRRWF
jgi:hypothetical protein